MKKTAYITIAAALIFTTMTMVGCSDYLDAEDKGAGSDADSYFATEAGIASAKANAFYNLYNVATNYALYDAGTDLYIGVRSSTTYNDYDRYAFTAEDATISSFYANCYNLEQAANFYLETAGSGTVGEAEGIFLRAYAYYLLTQQFGAVPYMGKYISNSSRNYPRESLESLYSMMEEQLTDVYNSGVLPDTDYEGNVSNQAVAFLLSKFYLAHAWDVNTTLTDAAAGTYSVGSTDNFTKAAEWAVTAINGLSLSSQTFEEKWSPDNEGNFEQIWSIQYDRDNYPGDVSSGGHNLQNMYGSYYGSITSLGVKKSASYGAQSEKSLYLFEEGDTRWAATFMQTMANYDGSNWPSTGYYAYYNNDNYESLPISYQYFPYWYTEEDVQAEYEANASRYVTSGYKSVAVIWLLAIPATQFTFSSSGGTPTTSSQSFEAMCTQVGGGATVKKFDDPDTQMEDNDEIDYRDIVVMDLSDMYLTAAEAYLLAGNTSSALSYLNAVRSRAGVDELSSFSSYEPMYSSSLETTELDVVLDERARELYAQQTRWVDLRRTKQLVRYNVAYSSSITSASEMQGTDGEIKWLRPIPADAISGNEALTDEDQNPGY